MGTPARSPCSHTAASAARAWLRLTAPTFLVLAVVAEDLDTWPIKCAKNCNGRNMCEQACSGVQKQTHACPAQEDCPLSALCPEGTKPLDCAFSAWGEWTSNHDCTGLCHRNRSIVQANRCGGAPCEGPLHDSKACPMPDGCEVTSQDCHFGAWTEWTACGSKTKCQRERIRIVEQEPFHGGKLCEGPLSETEVCGVECNPPVHCLMSEWMSWSPCTRQCGGGQTTRLRTIITKASNGGRTCNSALSENKGCNVGPCQEEATVDCQMSMWSDWSECTTGDQKMRKRTIEVPPKGGGKACEAELAETAGCGEKANMLPVECKLGDWSAWQLCDKTCGGGQTFRNRELVGTLDGAQCDRLKDVVETVETMSCNAHPCSLDKESCRVATWSEWSVCSTTCGAGQQTRDRYVVAEAQAGGVACELPLRDTRMCPGERVSCPTVDCQWNEWTEWTGCSATCDGTGQRSRHKSIRTQASLGGRGCDAGTVSEVEPCGKQPCHPEVCVNGEWGEWEDWTQCSKSCRGGFRWHSRRVSIEANHCGEPTQGPATQEESCNDDIVCRHDVDCTLSEWSEWSDCDSKCRGNRVRSRVLQVPASGSGSCGEGQEASAPLEQVETCTGPADGTEDCGDAPKKQCSFGMWQEWEACSVTCGGGQTVRRRQITSDAQPAAIVLGNTEISKPASNFGRRLQAENPCESGDSKTWAPEKVSFCCRNFKLGCPTKEPEDPKEEPKDEKPVEKKEEAPKVDTSFLCEGATMVTQPCNSFECDVTMIDCSYGDWSDWGLCTKCDGQRMRHRGVVTEAQHGGRACEHSATEETQPCPRSCGKKLYFCVWGDWSALGDCTKSCGDGGTRKRTRKMELTEMRPENPLAVATDGEDCAGELTEHVPCKDSPSCESTCKPQDCVLSEWSDWGDATCEGVCRRTRSVVQLNNDCGKPCSGVLNTTKACQADCNNKDCKLSEWSGWSTCKSDIDQKYKMRSIIQEPSFNGMGCTGVLNLTSACVTGPDAPENCKLSSWTEWSDCDKTCGAGQQSRVRGVLHEASNGGSPCEGVLQITRTCQMQKCPDVSEADIVKEDCVYTPWSIWSRCEGESNQQAFRTRYVQKPAANGGKACEGEVQETRGCDQDRHLDADCFFSDWSTWSSCPVSCGGGEHTRSRSIDAHARGGGRRCEGAMLEARPCGETECPGSELISACEYSEWSKWTACSATCGAGYRSRKRALTQPGISGDDGCTARLEEVETCEDRSCDNALDCIWGAWADWSECVPAPDVCGVGYKKRSRDIQQMPLNGGALCMPRIKEQVMPVSRCRGQPECCVDGKWDDWGPWEACTATCGKGTKKRERVLAVKETWCGDPAPGSGVEYAGCDAPGCEGDQDCEFSEWTEWLACSANCHGNRTRHRDIKVHAIGSGSPCSGSLETIERCNPAEGQPDPWSCEGDTSAPKGTRDCLLAEWSEWTECSATCKGGIQLRSRHVQIHPEIGGKPCEPSLKETQPCNDAVNCFPGRVDCEWEDWMPWSECNNLDFTFRTRGMKTLAAGGGVACDGDVREMKPCVSKGDGDQVFGSCIAETYQCSWGKWTAWSNCSQTCGTGGVRTRERRMEVSDFSSASDAQEKFDMSSLESRLKKLEQRRLQDSAAAFGIGFSSLLALLVVMRTAQASARAVRHGNRGPEYDAVPQHA